MQIFSSSSRAPSFSSPSGCSGGAVRKGASRCLLMTRHLATVVALAMTVVTACGRQAHAKYVIGFSQANLAEPWRAAMNAEIAARAKDFPDIEIVYADAAQDNAKQVADVENF